ncbi:hypothetical protein B0G84_3286 [Paraburkholderia sp. BL8N3]|nr:hypothetical protein [Paraburkholderia sp. BL8N3]TCK37985.1 hypothetical protein B0G84_3286 [Paraburkholderia sp. BL8N3]
MQHEDIAAARARIPALSRAPALVEDTEQPRRPDRAVRLHLSADRNQCPDCGQCFNSTGAFDKHRAGPFGSGRTPAARRCLLPHEMREQGMARNAAGFWTKGAMTDAERTRIEERKARNA